jgi:predicted ribosome quality control (RQC) complex YloA/Tae2 family protein
MSLRPSEIAQVVAELDEGLRGAVLQKASMPSSQLAYLELRQPGRSTLLCLCAQRETRRISVAELRPPGSPQPPALQRLMRTQLVGFRLTRIALENAEVRLTFEKPEAKRLLALQLLGEGELVMLTDDGRAVATGTNRRYQPAPGALDLSVPSRLSPSSAEDGAVGDASAPFPRAPAAARLAVLAPRAQDAEARRRALLAPLKTRLARIKRTQAKVAQEADRGAAAEEHRRLGELLSQNLFRIHRGDRQVTLTEYTAEGPNEVEVVLDPSRAPKDEAERHFHQYRRLLRGTQKGLERLAQLEAERADVEAALERAAQLSEDELAQVDLTVARGEREARAQHRPFKEYRAVGGERIWVGRGGAENDALTFHVARPQDLWLHVRGVPGAHVVVPLEKNAEIPQELLIDAAHLALHHSDLHGEPKGEVSYVLAKFVRKQKGGAPGQVTYTREKTFVVRVEPARLERLLRSRTVG